MGLAKIRSVNRSDWVNSKKAGYMFIFRMTLILQKKVGQRHGKEVVYQVASGQMHRDGYKFYLSVNNVWLTKEVPTKYLER